MEEEPEGDVLSDLVIPLGETQEGQPISISSTNLAQSKKYNQSGLSAPLEQIWAYGEEEKLHIEVKVYPSDQLEISELVLDQQWLRE